MAENGRKFGDEKSTLLDEFERLSFEAHSAQLSRAMLGRSLSEPRLQGSHSQSRLIKMVPIPLVTQVMQRPNHGRSSIGSGFQRVLKKLLKPIYKMRGGRKQVNDPKDIMFCKAYSKSLRF